MDSFYFDAVKAEKTKAMQRYNRVRSVAKLFRLTEIFLVLVFLAWTSTHVPFAVKISAEFLAKLGGVIVSPLFVFLLCNAIIATLLAKSGKLTPEKSGSENAVSEIYEEIAKHSEDRQTVPFPEDSDSVKASVNETVFQDKEIVSELNAAIDLESDQDLDYGPDLDLNDQKAYRRSKSEMFIKEVATEKRGKELRRSETERIGILGEKLHPQEEISDEEFNRRIEEFIAKQLQFRREESMSIVLR